MMYGYGTGGWWMTLMPSAVDRAHRRHRLDRYEDHPTRGTEAHRQSPLEILDRRYARGAGDPLDGLAHHRDESAVRAGLRVADTK